MKKQWITTITVWIFAIAAIFTAATLDEGWDWGRWFIGALQVYGWYFLFTAVIATAFYFLRKRDERTWAAEDAAWAAAARKQEFERQRERYSLTGAPGLDDLPDRP